MSPRARVIVVVVASAALAAAAVVGITIASGDRPQATAPSGPPQRRGAPPLSLDLGVRTDREARDLRQALGLYEAGKRTQAAALFQRYDSLEARVGRAFSAWPDGTLARLTQLAGLHPTSAVIQLNLGIVQLWAGKSDGKAAWRSAATSEPDSAYAVTAGNLLYPEYARNLPIFVPTRPIPAAVTRLQGRPDAQLALLARNAGSGRVDDRLFYGVALQRLGKQRSAERQYAAAARSAPNDVQAQVAAAVGRFDKARPAAAFSRLGPLTRRFPRAATVRFHLGLLLLWSGQVKEAKRQLALARTAEPSSPLAREAARYLDELAAAGV